MRVSAAFAACARSSSPPTVASVQACVLKACPRATERGRRGCRKDAAARLRRVRVSLTYHIRYQCVSVFEGGPVLSFCERRRTAACPVCPHSHVPSRGPRHAACAPVSGVCGRILNDLRIHGPLNSSDLSCILDTQNGEDDERDAPRPPRQLYLDTHNTHIGALVRRTSRGGRGAACGCAPTRGASTKRAAPWHRRARRRSTPPAARRRRRRWTPCAASAP